MRAIIALLFLLVPLRSAAAVALCVFAEHGHAAACGPGMDGMEQSEDRDRVVRSDTGADSLAGCSAIGLCAATPPGVTPIVTAVVPEQRAEFGLSLPTSLLKPGIRPPPPVQPPRA